MTTARVGTVQSVTGPVEADRLGRVLPHEHVLCDFVGAGRTDPSRWDTDTVIAAMHPRLAALVARGVSTFVDCTPAFIGRDPVLLRRLAEATGLIMITNTGLYGGADDAFVPAWAYDRTADQLAQEWIAEAEEGIGGTGIRPGFVKTGVDEITGSTLSAIDATLVRAAALTSTATGLAVTCHTGGAAAGLAAARAFVDAGGDPARFVVAHADGHGLVANRQVADLGAWVSLDAVGRRDPVGHAELVLELIAHRSDRILLSQDSGWWNAGTDDGGEIADYTALVDDFLPVLRTAGATDEHLEQLIVRNPAAMLVGVPWEAATSLRSTA